MRRNFPVIFISVILLLSLFLCGCSGETVEPAQAAIEPQIPEDYVTYTDKAGVFNISYPPGWELRNNVIRDIEQYSRDIENSIDENIPLEGPLQVFLAGLPVNAGYSTTISVMVAPVPAGIHNIEEFYEQLIAKIKDLMKGFKIVSQDKEVIDGKEAVIAHFKYDLHGGKTGHSLETYMISGKNVWSISCTVDSDENYDIWEDDFNNIVRSLRILK
jgi:hypothetical protein